MVKFRFFAPVGAVAVLALAGCSPVVEPAGAPSEAGITLSSVSLQVSEAPDWLTSVPDRPDSAAVLPEASEQPVEPADSSVELESPTADVVPVGTEPPVEETIVAEPPVEDPSSAVAEAPAANGSEIAAAASAAPDPVDIAPAVNNSPGAPAPVPSFMDGVLIAAGSGPQLIGSFATGGAGYINIDYSRDPNSTVPNVPTFTEIRCDGKKMYFGAHNSTSGTGWQLPASFTGAACDIYVDARQPSANYDGTYSGIYVRAEAPVATQAGGSPIRVQGGSWVSQAVPGVSDFVYDTPGGFRGSVDLKLTACSSHGGTSDASAAFACGALVEPGVGSAVSVEWFDAAGSLGSQQIAVSAQEHHSMLHFDLPRAAAGPVTARVTRTSGSAMLVHSVHSNAIGVLP